MGLACQKGGFRGRGVTHFIVITFSRFLSIPKAGVLLNLWFSGIHCLVKYSTSVRKYVRQCCDFRPRIMRHRFSDISLGGANRGRGTCVR